MSADRLRPWIEERRPSVERTLERLLPRPEGPAATLAAAMRYAVFSGGKRLRPLVVLASCEACGGDTASALEPAAAMELVHTYSLVHDDLPAMDDDDLRRGRPTTHRAFDEATAILCGDALLTLALGILAPRPRAVALAARGAGAMVEGQIADLRAEGADVGLDDVTWIHEHKTGALLSASAELGAVVAGADAATAAALARYGRALGLAFQAADDVLDRTSTAEVLGKTPGKDAGARKATVPSLLGIEGARRAADSWAAAAISALDGAALGDRSILEGIARYAVSRSS